MIKLIIVEDNEKLRIAMMRGLQDSGKLQVVYDCGFGEESMAFFNQLSEKEAAAPDGILMDVKLAGEMNGIQAAVEIRREYPRMPVVFYSIQDDDSFYRDFRNSGILSHYAYVKKSNYLLPQMILPLIEDAVRGQSFIDPDIEARVKEVWHRDENSPMSVLEPNERAVAQLLIKGMNNEQIAAIMGFQDKRTISRINGQIYHCWGLNNSTMDEKVARTRAVIIAQQNKMIVWDAQGNASLLGENGELTPWQ